MILRRTRLEPFCVTPSEAGGGFSRPIAERQAVRDKGLAIHTSTANGVSAGFLYRRHLACILSFVYCFSIASKNAGETPAVRGGGYAYTSSSHPLILQSLNPALSPFVFFSSTALWRILELLGEAEESGCVLLGELFDLCDVAVSQAGEAGGDVLDVAGFVGLDFPHRFGRQVGAVGFD